MCGLLLPVAWEGKGRGRVIWWLDDKHVSLMIFFTPSPSSTRRNDEVTKRNTQVTKRNTDSEVTEKNTKVTKRSTDVTVREGTPRLPRGTSRWKEKRPETRISSNTTDKGAGGTKISSHTQTVRTSIRPLSQGYRDMRKRRPTLRASLFCFFLLTLNGHHWLNIDMRRDWLKRESSVTRMIFTRDRSRSSGVGGRAGIPIFRPVICPHWDRALINEKDLESCSI